MRFLLTSAGIKNPCIHDALVDPLGTPIAECDALSVVDGTVEVVSEAHRKLFTPER